MEDDIKALRDALALFQNAAQHGGKAGAAFAARARSKAKVALEMVAITLADTGDVRVVDANRYAEEIGKADDERAVEIIRLALMILDGDPVKRPETAGDQAVSALG